MTDHETPGFKVVDKRRATTEGAAAETEVDPGASAFQTPGTDPAETQAAPQTEAPTEGDAHDASASPQSEEDYGRPDPTMLMSFAAMQMDVRSLLRTLTTVFDGQAWRALGLVADPLTGEPKKDLPAAQLAIDAVQFLLGKIEVDLSEGERRELQRRLNDLRMNYLAKLREG